MSLKDQKDQIREHEEAVAERFKCKLSDQEKVLRKEINRFKDLAKKRKADVKIKKGRIRSLESENSSLKYRESQMKSRCDELEKRIASIEPTHKAAIESLQQKLDAMTAANMKLWAALSKQDSDSE